MTQTGSDPALAAYMQAAKAAPYLTAEEESELARRARDGDKRAADKLALAHLRLVIKIAVRYRGYGLPLADLVGEGSAGLMQAIQRFQVEKGWRLATYAVFWIRSAIGEYVMHNRSMVKLVTTVPGKRLFFNLSRHLSEADGDGDLTPDRVATIARALMVPEQDVVTMHRRTMAPDASLNAPMAAEDGDSRDWQELLADDAELPDAVLADSSEDEAQREMLRTALAGMTDTDRHVLVSRRLHGVRLEDLSQQYNVSRERVRQLEVAAFDKLQSAVERLAAERRRVVMERKPWAMPPVVMAAPDPDRQARELAESETARPRYGRRRKVALAA